MNINRCQNQPNQVAFSGYVKSVDQLGLSKINLLNEVTKIAVDNAKTMGNNKTAFSFYLTPHGSIGVHCEETFTPEKKFPDLFLKSTTARGDGFVFRDGFKKLEEKLIAAMNMAVKTCYDTKEGRYILKEKSTLLDKKLENEYRQVIAKKTANAKKQLAEEEKNRKLLSLMS